MKNRTQEKSHLSVREQDQQNRLTNGILAQLERMREREIASALASERLLRFEELDGTKSSVVHDSIKEPLAQELEREEYTTNEEIGMEEIIEYDNIYEAIREYEEMRDNDINREDDPDKDWDEMDY